MTVSVNCMTRGPAGRVTAILRLLRQHVDDILVAVDERAEPEVARSLATVADRVVLYPYAEPVDRPLAWLHAECMGDWVLTIDDDEIPGAGLLDQLRSLSEATDVTHYWLPRRWLYGDAGRYLAQPPWRPDYQLRLVRNDPRLLSFPDEMHKPIAILGPGRYAETPLYHADTLLTPLEQRREKARRYERLGSRRRIAGRPLNRLYYLPELLGTPRTVELPARDAELVASVLAAAPEPGPDAPLERATRRAIDRFWAGRELGDSAYRARLTLLEDWRTLTAGEVRAFDVAVENAGDETWPWGRRVAPEIRLSYRWLDAEGRVAVGEGLRTPLPADVSPGASAVVPVDVAAPATPGRYTLEIDLLHEHHRWFASEVSCEVEVQAHRRVGLMADDADALAADLERIAEAPVPAEPIVFGRDPQDLAARLGIDTAPGPHAYLLDGVSHGRAGAAVLAARTAALVRAARKLRVGTSDGGPADAFLRPLAATDLFVVGRDDPPVRAAAALAAAALGVPTVLVEREEGRDRLLNRALLALAERRAGARPRDPLAPLLGAQAPQPAPPTVDVVDRPAPPRERPEWEYVPEGWARAARDPDVKGWNVDAVAAAQRAKWPSFLRALEASGPLGVYHEVAEGEDVTTTDPSAHNLVMTFGYVIALAARGRERVSVLDWGGGAGHYYPLARTLLPRVEIEYAVKDVPKLAALGRELLPDVRFFDDDSCLDERYDLVMASGSLQYAEDWPALLRRFAGAAERLVYVTRLPVAFHAPSFVVVQRTYAYGYDTEYLGWVLNRDELIAGASVAGLQLIREFLLEARFSAARAPEDPVGHRGFLWEPAAARTRS